MTQTTREKLIHAALEVFAEQGYRDATIQEIVNRAGTNIAAVNYHFRDKANFYADVVVHAIDAGGCDGNRFPEVVTRPQQELHDFIRWFIHQAMGIGKSPSFLDQIHMQELMNPSPVLDHVVSRLIRPTHNYLRRIVSALLPTDASEEQIRHHCFSIIGQCNLYKLARPIMIRLYPDIPLDDEDYADRLVEHIHKVSLAALRAEHSEAA